MIGNDKREAIEAEYGMPVERLMYHFYQECGMSAGEIAAELDGIDTTADNADAHNVHRNTVKYWLRQSGIEMRTRQLSDVQRILMLAYFDAGLGDGSIAHRIECGQATVNRYRKDIEAEREPADLDSWISAGDYELLTRIVDDAFEPPDQ